MTFYSLLQIGHVWARLSVADYGNIHDGLVECYLGQRMQCRGDCCGLRGSHPCRLVATLNQRRYNSCRHCEQLSHGSLAIPNLCYSPLQTADEYLIEYDRLRGSEYSRFHGYTYDGIWAAALAIQYVAEKREDLLTHFDYRVKDWENIFLEALRNTSFEGVTVGSGQNMIISVILYTSVSGSSTLL